MDTRRCPRCERELPVDRFGKNAAAPGGLQSRCRECVNADLRAYRARDGRAAANRHSRDWARRNREKTHIAQARWRERNRERKRLYDQRRYQNPEIRAAQRERQRAREAADPELRERRLKLAKLNREKNRERIRERARERARERYQALHPPTPPLTLRERFDAKVIRGDDGSCWGWRGATLQGYGKLHVRKGRVLMAHRIAYEAAYGPIPPKHEVIHTCDGPRSCVNPAHLVAVTRAERVRRDRQRAAKTQM